MIQLIQLKNTKNWEITQDHPRTGRPRTARTPKKIKAVRERIRRNQRRTIKGMAESLEISPYSMLSIVKKDPINILKILSPALIEMKKRSVYLSTQWCTIAHLEKKLNHGADKTSPHFGTKKCSLLPFPTH